MSAVCILTPLVIAAWPAFSAAVVAAAGSLGYQVLSEIDSNTKCAAPRATSVQLEIPRSEVVTGQLGRDQRIVVAKGGVQVVFSRDARGKASLCVTGTGQTEAELKAMGEEISQTVVQHYVYQKLMDEMSQRGFVVVDQETNADRSIRLKVRHWEN